MNMTKLHSFLLIFAVLVTSSLAFAEPQTEPVIDDGLFEARQSFFNGVGGAVRFRNLEPLFNTVIIKTGGKTWDLPYDKNQTLDELSFQHADKEYSLDEFLVSNRTNALLVLKNGKIVTELYRNGSNENDLFMSFSTGKSFTSTLIGMAVEDGYINSIDDQLMKYLPKLKGSGYDGVTIREALQMASGVDYREDYEPPADAGPDWVSQFEDSLNKTLFGEEMHFSDYAATLQRIHPPGTVFNYNTFETMVLGSVVSSATGMRLEEYFEKRLWQPAGMEADARLILDGPAGQGEAAAGGGYLMTLRDYGRFGLMFLNEGKADGKQLISAEWVKEATHPDPDKPFLQVGAVDKNTGYQFQWWLLADDNYTAEGVFGQWVYVNPAAQLVIVKLSYWENAWELSFEEEALAFFDAVVEHLSKE